MSSWKRTIGLAGVAQVLADDRGEVAAGRVAGDGEAARVGAEQRGVRVRPAGGGERVVGGGREASLGREAVADVEDDGARGVRERPADAVVRVDRAEQPAAAVEVDDERQRVSPGVAPAGRYERAGIAPPATGIEWSATAATASPAPRPANSDSKLTRASATGSRWAFGRPDAATSSSSFLATGSSGTAGDLRRGREEKKKNGPRSG